MRILCTNLGYARNIDGSWKQHIGSVHRYLYTSHACQIESLSFLRETIDDCKPDLSCFLEIDQGSLANGFLDQLSTLHQDGSYTLQAENKYGRQKQKGGKVGQGKSNGFLARIPVTYEKHFLRDGFKRLVYEIGVAEEFTVFLVHLALSRRIRKRQLEQLAGLVAGFAGEKMIIGDFNVFGGESELSPLTGEGFSVVNDMSIPTFRLGNYQTCVDLCLATPGLAKRTAIEVLDQPCSDHQMLLIDVDS